MAGPLGSQQIAASPNALAQAVNQLIRRLDGGGLQGASNYLDSVGTTQTLPYAIGGAALGGLAGGALGGGVGALPGALTGAIGGNMIGQVLTGTSGILPTPPPSSDAAPNVFRAERATQLPPSTGPRERAIYDPPTRDLSGASSPSLSAGTQSPSLSASSAPSAASAGGPVGAATGFTEAEAREITRMTVGREMSLNELEQWVGAFAQEHNGEMPWQSGPFDADNNFIDHLMALGESQRQVAMGPESDYTKLKREGNPMADAAITPDFWSDAYYTRYRGPTYIQTPYGPIDTGDQYLKPGQMPPTNAPSEKAFYDAISPRPYYHYQPAMSPGEWQTPAPASGTSTGTGYGYRFQPTLYGVK